MQYSPTLNPRQLYSKIYTFASWTYEGLQPIFSLHVCVNSPPLVWRSPPVHCCSSSSVLWALTSAQELNQCLCGPTLNTSELGEEGQETARWEGKKLSKRNFTVFVCVNTTHSFMNECFVVKYWGALLHAYWHTYPWSKSCKLGLILKAS